jgi:protein-S-isoprenylcysteine O-methyltransferase Ste14
MQTISPSPSHAGPSWFRGFVQGKTRIVLAWIFAAFLVFSARNYPTWPGIWLCFFGATLRFWASGYLRKDSRPAVGGPYGFVRNPLYLGTYLMAVGTAWATENYILLGTITVLFAVIYHYIILDEETKLRTIFGEPYLQYLAAVPRFFPRFLPAPRAVKTSINPEPSHQVYSLPLAMKNKAYEAYASFAGLIGFVALVAYGWKWWGY